MGFRVCAEPGCPAIVEQRYCTTHTRDRDKARGSRQARGYDADHDQLRAHWQRRLDAGALIACTSPTCLTPGVPIDRRDWHLGHDDQRRHRSPEHPGCNLSAAGRASHGLG